MTAPSTEVLVNSSSREGLIILHLVTSRRTDGNERASVPCIKKGPAVRALVRNRRPYVEPIYETVDGGVFIFIIV